MPLVHRSSPSLMEGEQTRKRRTRNNISQIDRPAKKRKRSSRVVSTPFSPAFYDELTEIPLTLNILLELDKRNDTQAKVVKQSNHSGSLPKDVTRFARRGGPDLQHLRQSASKLQSHSAMADTRSDSRSRRTVSTRATSVTSRSGSSRYGKEFEQHLRDHGIYMNNRKSQPSNTEEVLAKLEQSRASLSPSQFSHEQFESFRRENEDVVFESDVMANVFPIICGNSRIPSRQNVLFTELAPLTNGNAVRPKPDHFDGSNLTDLKLEVRSDDAIKREVIPTKHHGLPVAANFFMEAKGPDGNASVAQRQACYDGAYGARAMHTLQNYGKIEPEYDECAYTYSSTYHPATGTLQLYTHHVTAKANTEERQEYHMTPAGVYALTHNRDSFVRGTTAFRNARDIAKSQREQFIRAANLHHERDHIQENVEDWQHAHDFLQGQIAAACASDSADELEEYDDSQLFEPKSSQASTTPVKTVTSVLQTTLEAETPDLSFATSFTSGFSNEPPARLKRARQLSSPNNSLGRNSSKSRTRPNLNNLNCESY